MRRRNPAPDAPWIEQAKWQDRPSGRGLRRHVIELMWVDADSKGGMMSPVWSIISDIRQDSDRRGFTAVRLFAHGVGIHTQGALYHKDGWHQFGKKFSINIGVPALPKKLTDDDLRAVGMRGQFILQQMLARWRPSES